MAQPETRSVGVKADGRHRRERGQGLVEFSLVIPFVVLLLMALLELVLATGASLSVNRASQGAAHVAASAGNLVGADCLILRRVERDIAVPNNDANIIEVVIERSALAGNQSYGQQVWHRSGRSSCQLADGSTVELDRKSVV